MKGDPQILDVLNECLTAELTAINQYFVHYKMCENWGYQRLAQNKREESIGEMRHAETLMDRILYFDGIPNMQRLNTVLVGETVPEMHRVDLELEYGNVTRLNDAIALCRDQGDNGTREMLEQILKGEEEAVDYLETQLHMIEELGVERYLAEMIHGG